MNPMMTSVLATIERGAAPFPSPQGYSRRRKGGRCPHLLRRFPRDIWARAKGAISCLFDLRVHPSKTL